LCWLFTAVWSHIITECQNLTCPISLAPLPDSVMKTCKGVAVYLSVSGFGGLEVVCWPLVPKFAGLHPAETVGFLGQKKKIPSTPSFGGEVPCRSFTARKICLNVTCKSAFRQNYRTFLAHSSTFRRWVLSRGDAWRRLVAKVGTSNSDGTISLKDCSA
jgi:hypothetical protein